MTNDTSKYFIVVYQLPKRQTQGTLLTLWAILLLVQQPWVNKQLNQSRPLQIVTQADKSDRASQALKPVSKVLMNVN